MAADDLRTALLSIVAFENVPGGGLALGPDDIPAYPVVLRLASNGLGRAIYYTTIFGLSNQWAAKEQRQTVWLQGSLVGMKTPGVVFVVFVMTAQGSLTVYRVLPDNRRVPIEGFRPVTWPQLPSTARVALDALENLGRWTREHAEPSALPTMRTAGTRASDGLDFTPPMDVYLVDLANSDKYRSGGKLRRRQ
jgi:hypothetical protein